MTKPETPPSTLLVDRIAYDIQSGVLGAGSWLKQIDLQERYGAKRIEVRRALDHLTMKRLIQHVPNRGYHVYAMDRRSSREIHDIRAMLECGALDYSMDNLTPAKMLELRALAERFEQLLRTGTVLEQYEVNVAFHKVLYELCENRELVALIVELRGRSPSAPADQWRTWERIEKSSREHFELLDALEARDLPAAKRVLAAHILQLSG
jgi:DNA-binding GntR family transcriptional regulator